MNFQTYEKIKKEIEDIVTGEVRLLLGCMLVICCNKVPSVSDDCSYNNFLGNLAIKSPLYVTDFSCCY